MHPNDTLQGRLLAYERPEQKHLRHKLGYWRLVEERMIRAEWSGPEEPTIFDIAAAYEANHKNDVTYAETSRAFSARAGRALSALNDDEWAYLAETFNGANHPLAMSIHQKATERLLGNGRPTAIIHTTRP